MTVAQKLIGLQRGFDPLSITGLVGWYDFSDATKLFTDTGFTTPVANDADAIAGILDKSTNAWNATQSDAAKKPAYKTAIQNGRSVGRITNGTSGLASVVKALVPQPVTVLSVFKQTSKLTSARIIDSTDNGLNRILMGLDTSGFAQYYASGGVVSDAADHSGAFIVLSAVFNGASSKLYVNGSNVAAGNPGTVDFGTVNQIGWDLANGITGDMGEILIYNSGLSTANHNAAGSGLASKWGLTWTAIP